MPLVLVTVPKTEKRIYNLEHVTNVLITVKFQRPKTRIRQCYRCQRFGHAQSRCTVTPKCVKYAGTQHYTECTKGKDTPSNCGNCGESHTASYRGCHSLKRKHHLISLYPKENATPTQQKQTFSQLRATCLSRNYFHISKLCTIKCKSSPKN